jgi:hypothetical protein
MPERLVDVETQGSQVLHTFPVTISAPAAEEDAFKEKGWRRRATRSWSPTRNSTV